jgi:hypothetical protein
MGCVGIYLTVPCRARETFKFASMSLGDGSRSTTMTSENRHSELTVDGWDARWLAGILAKQFDFGRRRKATGCREKRFWSWVWVR